MDQQRSAVERLRDIKQQLAEAHTRYVSDMTNPPVVLSVGGAGEPIVNNLREAIGRHAFRYVLNVFRDCPDATLEQAQKHLKPAWAARRGRSTPRALKLSPELVRELRGLHDALIKEDPDRRNCKTECAKIADEVGLGAEVVRKLMQQAKGRKS